MFNVKFSTDVHASLRKNNVNVNMSVLTDDIPSVSAVLRAAN